MISIILGTILVILGFLYFYLPNIVIKLCDFIKKYFFNEKTIILYGKKIGLIMFLLGVIILTTKISRYYTHQDKYYLAKKEFYQHNFFNSEKLCIEILSLQPKNTLVLELLGKIYLATNRPELAKKIFDKIKTIDKSKAAKMDKYLEKISLKQNK
jgi:tetratricopeptide (TPR) repeat protein